MSDTRGFNCSNCNFGFPDEAEMCACHRHAPAPTPEFSFANWPVVKKTDWCGEYRQDLAKKVSVE